MFKDILPHAHEYIYIYIYRLVLKHDRRLHSSAVQPPVKSQRNMRILHNNTMNEISHNLYETVPEAGSMLTGSHHDLIAARHGDSVV